MHPESHAAIGRSTRGVNGYHRKAFPKAVKPSGTRMHGQVLAQLASHALRNEPSREVIEASLETLFGFWGYSKDSGWWDGREVMTRLPLLALYGRLFFPSDAGADLLHAQRNANPHLIEPPPRNVVVPAEVMAAIEKIESVLAEATRQGRGVEVSLTEEGNAYQVQ